ncbi:unnamed protein product [Tuber aestivum]|uniref:Uncharacterized protein n=1 Tax=Tuber aestivum TaxID=59557 RepID=A0A292PPI8_9PEZI|nr:unnamed protein product [Tuber aestivum]
MDPPATPESGLFHPARDSMQVHSETPSGYTSSNEDHFSDAPEGPDAAAGGDNTKFLVASPQFLPSLSSIPLVLVEKIDERPSHGEVPGTEAFEKRTADASPDVIRIQQPPDLLVAAPGVGDPKGKEQEVEEERKSGAETPRSKVPITMVERVDSTPAHGEILGTEAFAKRLADAAPDVIRTATSSPIPMTVVSVIDSDKPLYGEVLGTEAHKMRAADAQPDVVVKWNEEEDKIARRVRGERERIEKLMMDPGRARSVSPGQGPGSVVPVVKGRMDSVSKITLPIGEVKGKKEGKAKDVNGVEKEGEGGGVVEEQSLRSRSSSISSRKCGSPVLDESPGISVDALIGVGVEEAKEVAAEEAKVEEVKEEAKGQVIADINGGDNGEAGDEEEGRVARREEETTTEENETRGEGAGDGDNGFGDDDFDDFGEVVEGGDFDDFGGFGEAEAFVPPPIEASPPPPPPPQIPIIPVPVLDLEKLDNEDTIRRAAAEAMAIMFPIDKEKYQNISPISIDDNAFLTERSLSLWNQLSAPPPLQPPNWKISRIRRLFLVSLGVPVDLDEILPAETKQKKLVLPSVNIARKSIDGSASRRNSRSRSRVRRSTSSSRRKSGVIGPEALDVPSARILCSTSDVALQGLTAQELKEHIKKLESITSTASEVLTYWLKKREGAISDKETFETVIESLVGYARKKRQNG